MGDGGRLALAILMLLGAMILLFFAFHPGGVAAGAVKNPADMLNWLMGEFSTTAGATSGAVSSTSPPSTTPGG
jgi:hypothetical protein